ncbi:MAG: sensor histidine kinase [Verrucomicrobiota bacterium]|nr:sensor histidine kinase [Verrucomicrobiota bacterium]
MRGGLRACGEGWSLQARGVRFRSAALLSFGLVAALRAQIPAATGTLENCTDIRAQPLAEAAAGRPVRLRGVVTLVPGGSGGRYFTIDDGTGIWVSQAPVEEAAQRGARVSVGDVVEVIGRSQAGRLSPQVAADQVNTLGRGPLSPARRVTPLELSFGQFDCQRVSISGVVQMVEVYATRAVREWRLQVKSPQGRFNYILINPPGPVPDTLVDSEVELTGVCLSYFNSRRQFLGARIYSNEGADLRVLRPGQADAFSAPGVALNEVMAFSPAEADLHRRRVRGVVTFSSPGRYFYLQEGTSALRVNTREREALEPGDTVEAVGFFDLAHHRAEMHDAVFRVVGRVQPPVPVAITRGQAFAREPRPVQSAPQDFDDRLVTLNGRLVSLDEKVGEPQRLNLVCEGALVPAEFPDPVDHAFLAGLRPGSELQVSGICQLTFSDSRPVVEWPQPVALRLLVRSPADVVVVNAASFWTPARLQLALGISLLVLLAVLAWVVLLRRQVTLRSRRLAEEMRARRDAAVEFDTAMRERNRLAADLHDTMEQSLTGMALQLEASEALWADKPERSSTHLSLARQLLSRSREDLRRSICNLRASPLERQTLEEALREIAVHRSAGLNVVIEVQREGAVRPMPDFVAGNLLLLAQEGITNALKHGAPTRIRLGLTFAPARISLTIHDDGKGFDPAGVAGPASGHFGLQGMRERAKRLGGQLDITSAPGAGTTLTATVTD